MTEWIGVVTNTAKQYLKDAVDETMRNRLFLAMLRQKGRISYGHSGYDLNWNVEYDQPLTRDYGDGDDLLFPNHNAFVQASLDWGGAVATDRITEKQRLMNRGNLAIINLFGTKMSRLVKAMTDSFGGELYKDGNATGNELKIDGLETFFGTGTTVAADIVAQPSDTYAGLSTALGNYGGSWTTSGGNSVWPTGTGSAEYDFWSPLIVDYGNAAFNASSDNWRNNCVEALSYGITHSASKNKQAGGTPDVILLENELFRVLKDVQQAKQQVNITPGGGDGLWSMGFKDVIYHDGVEVTSEYGVPVGVGYGIPLMALELRSMQKTMFDTESDPEISTRATRFVVDFLGNLKCNPRPFVKWLDL